MTETRWSRIVELFEQALDVPRDRREQWLLEKCPDDTELRDEVAAMLQAHDAPSGILDHAPAAEPLPETSQSIRQRLTVLEDTYAIEGEIGEGGMAIVFLAQERKHHRPVVLKVLKPEIARWLGHDRFEREVHIAARLGHPNILGLIDSGEADGLMYYVMPYVEGETLRHRLDRTGPLPMGELLLRSRDIADAISHAHRMGVVHRDLKPANVLLAGDHAYLMDFGVAKMLRREADITKVGAAIGTPAYMAPEQRAADPGVDHRVDLYSWGLMTYEMLIGSLPDADSRSRITPAAILDRRPDAPPALAELIYRCLQHTPADRPSTADEVLDVVMELLSDPRSSSNVVIRPRSHRTWLTLGAVMAGILLAFGGTTLLSKVSGGGATRLKAFPVAVAAFTNETGEAGLATWGRLAGDWLTQGLQETGKVEVVPWPTSLQASELLQRSRVAGQLVDPVSLIGRETEANSVVTGSYYMVNDSIEFRVQITEVSTGNLLNALPPVTAHRDSAPQAIRVLQERLMGAVAILADDRFDPARDIDRIPPTFEAYQAFDRGMERYTNQDYRTSIPEFRQAYRLDSAFAVPLLYAAAAYWNTGEYQAMDSMLALVRGHRHELSDYHRHWAEFLESILDSDGERALRAIRLAASLSPGSKAHYNLALTALDLGRPQEALSALQELDPDRGPMRGWSSYWTQLTHAYHLLGEHNRELGAARELRARYPDRRVGLVLEIRALAAMGNEEAIDELIAESLTLPPTTYWSQAAAMVVAGEELMAHGAAYDRAERYFDQAVDWLLPQRRAQPAYWGHAYWLGSAYYDLQRWVEAADTFRDLQALRPRVGHRGMLALSMARLGRPVVDTMLGARPRVGAGEFEAYRARLAAVEGDIDLAISRLSDAMRLGIDGLPWLHASAYHDLLPLMDRRDAVPEALRVAGR